MGGEVKFTDSSALTGTSSTLEEEIKKMKEERVKIKEIFPREAQSRQMNFRKKGKRRNFR